MPDIKCPKVVASLLQRLLLKTAKRYLPESSQQTPPLYTFHGLLDSYFFQTETGFQNFVGHISRLESRVGNNPVTYPSEQDVEKVLAYVGEALPHIDPEDDPISFGDILSITPIPSITTKWLLENKPSSIRLCLKRWDKGLAYFRAFYVLQNPDLFESETHIEQNKVSKVYNMMGSVKATPKLQKILEGNLAGPTSIITPHMAKNGYTQLMDIALGMDSGLHSSKLGPTPAFFAGDNHKKVDDLIERIEERKQEIETLLEAYKKLRAEMPEGKDSLRRVVIQKAEEKPHEFLDAGEWMQPLTTHVLEGNSSST